MIDSKRLIGEIAVDSASPAQAAGRLREQCHAQRRQLLLPGFERRHNHIIDKDMESDANREASEKLAALMSATGVEAVRNPRCHPTRATQFRHKRRRAPRAGREHQQQCGAFFP
eukprot:COSAG06_NODE_3102_length_5858_cov_6.861087_3_plen_114_part_00